MLGKKFFLLKTTMNLTSYKVRANNCVSVLWRKKKKWAIYESVVAEAQSMKIHPMGKKENLIAKVCGQLSLYKVS